MFHLSEIPGPSPGELSFRLFGMPVRVHPFFWLYSLFMASNRETGQAIIWTLVVFVSILVHELGHGLAMRLFGERCEILLYAWGGLAVPSLGRRLKPAASIVVSLAGPLAGFGLAVLTMQVALWFGGTLRYAPQFFILPGVRAYFAPALPTESPFAHLYQSTLFNDLLFVNIAWGLVNLFPVYPLDGGQICRTLLGPNRVRLSLWISILVAGAAALAGLGLRSMYLFAFFALLAAGSAQALESMPRRAAGPSRLR